MAKRKGSTRRAPKGDAGCCSCNCEKALREELGKIGAKLDVAVALLQLIRDSMSAIEMKA